MQERFYSYRKLNTETSFRLLKIEPPPDDPNTQCQYSLIETTFEDAPRYETISYLWGTTDRCETVTLKDGESLRVTKPLKEALPFVEFHCSTNYLWIDQICIDQDDGLERGHQVKLMGQIYRSCSRVIVWLGIMGQSEAQNCIADDSKQRSMGFLVPKFFNGGLFKRCPDETTTADTKSIWLKALRSS